MNSFRKYPKLSYLFIAKIGVLLLFLGLVCYCKNEISENLKLLRTTQFEKVGSPIEKELRIIFETELDSYERQIYSNVNRLIGGTIVILVLFSFVNSSIRKENKRLDGLEEQNQP